MNREEHRTVRESLGAYVLGGLDDAEKAAVSAHLDGCADCRAELAEIEPVVGPLQHVDPDQLDRTPVPPPQLGEQIVERAVAERRPGPRRGTLLAAAAVVVAAVLGAGTGFAAGSLGTPAVPREPVAVQTLDVGIDASATVVPHTWGVEITLDADGFRAGAVYRVVVSDEAGRQVNAGEFIGTGVDPMRCNLNSSVLRTQATGFDVLDPDGTVVVHGEL